MKKIFVFLFTAFCACGTLSNLSAASPNAKGDRILGVYVVEGETTNALSHVEIYRKGDNYEAKIIWLEHPNDNTGAPLKDILNPDPKLREGRADNIRLIWDLTYDAKKEIWTGGTIYNPVEGKTYSVQISLDSPDRLKVRGYIGRPAFGRNLFWDRLKQ